MSWFEEIKKNVSLGFEELCCHVLKNDYLTVLTELGDYYESIGKQGSVKNMAQRIVETAECEDLIEDLKYYIDADENGYDYEGKRQKSEIPKHFIDEIKRIINTFEDCGKRATDPLVQELHAVNKSWFNVLKQTLKVGLIEGRHPMPVDEYIFETLPREGSLADKIPQLKETAQEWIASKGNVEIDLYVTGMTPVLTAFLRAWGNKSGLTLLHFDVSTKDYWREEWN